MVAVHVVASAEGEGKRLRVNRIDRHEGDIYGLGYGLRLPMQQASQKLVRNMQSHVKHLVQPQAHPAIVTINGLIRELKAKP